MKRFKVVLVGLGRMGRNHLRILGEDPGFEVVGVVDPVFPESSVQARSDQRVPVSKTLDQFLESPAGKAFDCAVIASPTSTHHSVTERFLDLGKSVLVEKPLASSGDLGESLIAKAKSKGLVLAVGHVERFNPAVLKLKHVLDAGWLGTPIHFSFTRVGGYPNEVRDGNNVLLDLAVHDLDVLQLLHGEFRVVSSICHSTWKEEILDTAEILLAHQAGVSASVHVNWVTPTKIRSLRVTGTQGVAFVDYILQSCRLMGGNLLKTSKADRTDFSQLIEDYRNSDQIEFGVQKQEPLKLEIRAFWQALSGEPSAICTGEEGLHAVRLAETAIQRSQLGIRHSG